MGSKNKLKRFNQNLTFKNVIQPTREELVENKFALKGNWNKDFFKNDNPIVLELGCGKGEYTVYLAQEHPNKNFIGIDLKGARFGLEQKNHWNSNLQMLLLFEHKLNWLQICLLRMRSMKSGSPFRIRKLNSKEQSTALLIRNF